MAAAILNQGKTSVRDFLKTVVTHVCVSDDNTAFDGAQTAINPAAGTTSTHVEAASNVDVDAFTFDSSITINGASEFTNKIIYAIGVSKGLGILDSAGTGTHTGGGIIGTDLITRSVRTLGIGIEATDTMTIGVRTQVQDNS